jgi:DNA helicase HerA-like ATPase
LPIEALSAHVYTIGISGSGKSKLLENIVAQLVAGGRGCGVIDPHSLLIDDLLAHLVTRQTLADPAIKRRILYVDPSRRDYVIPMNVLATPDEPYRVASSVIEAFRRTWPESLKEAPHFTNVMFHSLLLLIQTKRTLIDLPRLLVDKAFRDGLLHSGRS